MTRYICTACNFRFNSENPKECPYCGRSRIEKEKSAEELLEEVDKILDE